MWFLGAGASAGAGIPTAWDMIWEFKRLIYCTEQLEFSMDRLWLVLEPTVLGSKPSEDDTIADRQRRKEFVRERLATRYNKKWNELLDAWISVLSGGSDRWTVTTFGLTQGVDASFEIHATTGFSRKQQG